MALKTTIATKKMSSDDSGDAWTTQKRKGRKTKPSAKLTDDFPSLPGSTQGPPVQFCTPTSAHPNTSTESENPGQATTDLGFIHHMYFACLTTIVTLFPPLQENPKFKGTWGIYLPPGAVEGCHPATCYSFFDKKEKRAKWVSDCDELTQALDKLGQKYQVIISLSGKKGLGINVKARNPVAKAPSTQKVNKVCAEVLSFMMTTSAPSCTGFTFRKPLSREEQEERKSRKMEKSQTAFKKEEPEVSDESPEPASFASAVANPASVEALLAPAPPAKRLGSQLERLTKFKVYLTRMEVEMEKQMH